MEETTSFERPRGYDPPDLEIPAPYRRPLRPLRALRWWALELMWPQGLLWLLISVATFHWLTPDVSRFESLSLAPIALLYLRNVALMTVVIGGLHLHLHIRRGQGTRFKYDPRWLATSRKTFLFDHQTRDNVFWTLVSGGLIATGYETLMFWWYANDSIVEVSWDSAAAYIVVMAFALWFIEGVHFYLNHRLLHWDPLYKVAHSLHHRNVNTGPWSGISMHPIEHLIYFSTPLLFVVIPGHPFLVTLTLVYLMLSPAPSHSGFDRLVLRGDATLHNGDYFHNLHHRYFECNYGVLLLPIDKWMGTYHDGSDEAHERMRERRRAAGRR